MECNQILGYQRLMKFFFLILSVVAGVGVLFGFVGAVEKDIPITTENTPWEGLLLLIFSLAGWWLSRKSR